MAAMNQNRRASTLINSRNLKESKFNNEQDTSRISKKVIDILSDIQDHNKNDLDDKLDSLDNTGNSDLLRKTMLLDVKES